MEATNRRLTCSCDDGRSCHACRAMDAETCRACGDRFDDSDDDARRSASDAGLCEFCASIGVPAPAVSR